MATLAEASARRSTSRHPHMSADQLVEPASESDISIDLTEPRTKTWAELFPEGVNWPIAGWIVLLHVGALAAPWTFSWSGLVLALVLHWVTGGIGVCLGFHRLFTHASFKTYSPIRYLIAVIGGLSGEGSAIDWVANHRKHHALSDQPGDPHSPHDGPWWSHMFWFAREWSAEEKRSHTKRWVPDLAKDRGLVFIGKMFLPSHFATGLMLLAIGWMIGGWSFGLSLLVWGLFVRTVFVLHSTWLVNSASHMWGYINYRTRDDSRNNWWVALITYGEGWHNNHHAYPRMANHGHRWWEIDITYATIRLMESLGLAWDVIDYRNQSEKHDNDNLLTNPEGLVEDGQPTEVTAA